MTLKPILFIYMCQLAGSSSAQVSQGIQFNQRAEIEILPLLMATKNHTVSKMAVDAKLKDKQTLSINDRFYEWPVKSVWISGERLVFLADSPEDASRSIPLSAFPLLISKPPKLEELIACTSTNEVISVFLKDVKDIEEEEKFLKEVLVMDWLDIPDLVPPNFGTVVVRACYLHENRVVGVRFHAFSDRNGIKDGNSLLLRQSCKIWASAPIDR